MFNINVMKKTALIILSVTGLALAGSAIAKGHGNPHERGMEMQQQMRSILSKLDLTKEQKSQIKEIKQQRKTELKALKQNKIKGGSRTEMQALLMAENFDETKFKALQQQHAAKKQQLGIISARSLHQVFQVLTAEQKQKFLDIQKRQKNKHKKQRDGKGKNNN